MLATLLCGISPPFYYSTKSGSGIARYCSTVSGFECAGEHPMAIQYVLRYPFLWVCNRRRMPEEKKPKEKTDVWQGTLDLMILKTLDTLGPLHGYGIARRIEQTSGDRLSLNYGTLYPALLKLEQEGAISPQWSVSENNRRAKFYKLT